MLGGTSLSQSAANALPATLSRAEASSGPSSAAGAPSSGARSKNASLDRVPKELRRSGSMNLPKPEDSGVPAVHAEMCILRIRRNHLVEVRLTR